MAVATIVNPITQREDRIAAMRSRQVIIRLLSLENRGEKRHLDLTWNVGKINPRDKGRRPTTIRLTPGKSCTVPIEKAWGWFGLFTIPMDVQHEADEHRVRDALKDYEDSVRAAKLAWGDYPRPRKLADGFDAIGSHRFPDVELTVLEADGTQWDPIRLHKQYSLGEFDPQQFAAPVDHSVELSEKDAMKAQIAELTGMVKVLAAQAPVRAAQAGKV